MGERVAVGTGRTVVAVVTAVVAVVVLFPTSVLVLVFHYAQQCHTSIQLSVSSLPPHFSGRAYDLSL